MNLNLVIATKNQNKLKEISQILNLKGVKILSLLDFGNLCDIEEKGKSYYENAYLKAKEANKYTGLPSLADDSGLEVEILNNEPGIYSKRYAGLNASDEERINKLLFKLKNFPFEKRRARFICHLVLVDGEKIFNTMGLCDGFIGFKPEGKNGFGYDPVFFLPDLNKTMAQLSLKEKNIISHRANALKKMREIIINEYKL